MKKIFLLLALILQLPSFSQIPIDKQYHIGAGFIFGTWGTFAGNSCNFNPEKSALIGLGSSVAAGLGKELWDEAEYQILGNPSRFDFKDLGATVIGGIIGIGLSYAGLKIFYHYKPRIFIGNVQNSLTLGVQFKFN